MSKETNSEKPPHFNLSIKKHPVFYITSIYLLFGILWIVLSDNAILHLGLNEVIHQTIKGLFYVSITGLLLFFLVKRYEFETKEVIDELTTTKNNLKNVLDSIDDIVWSVNKDFTKFLFLSDSCELVYGYRKEEFFQNPFLWMNLVYEEDKEYVENNYKSLFEVGSLISIHRAYNKQNQVIWVQNKVWLVFDENKDIIRIDGITSNITKEKQNEIKINELYEEYRFLFEYNPYPVLLVNLDNLNIEKFNNSAVDLFWSKSNDNANLTNNGFEKQDKNQFNFKSILADFNQLPLITKLLDNNIDYYDYGIWKFKAYNKVITSQLFAHSIKEKQFNKNYKILVVNNITEHFNKIKELEESNIRLNQIINNSNNFIFEINQNLQPIKYYNNTELEDNIFIEMFNQHIIQNSNKLVIFNNFESKSELINIKHNSHCFEIIIKKIFIPNPNNTKPTLKYIIYIIDNNLVSNLRQENEIINKRLITMYNATANFHFIFTTDFKVFWFNKKAYDYFYGLSNKTLEYGVDFKEYLENLSPQRFVESFEKALSGLIVNYQTEFTFPLIDKTIWLDITFLPIYDNTELIGISLKLIDITDKIKKEKSLELLQKELENKVETRTKELQILSDEKDELLSLAAHDLKNPLSTILLQTSLIKKYTLNKTYEKIDDKIIDIENTINKMSNLITNLLEINRLETGKFKLYPSEVDINELIIDEINRYESYYSSKNIELELDFTENCKMYIDPHVFTQIFDNIFTNAIKYSHFNSTININLKNNENNITFSVQDFGNGISKSEMKLLYKKFSKLSSVPTAGENSSGLGLSITKKYIDLLGGIIKCESELGQGTKFTVIIPK